MGDSATERVWLRQHVRGLGPDVQRIAHRKLLVLDAAELLNDLRVPPGSRLELLRGSRAGQHGVRINDQGRICLVWGDRGPFDVEILDYHQPCQGVRPPTRNQFSIEQTRYDLEIEVERHGADFDRIVPLVGA